MSIATVAHAFFTPTTLTAPRAGALAAWDNPGMPVQLNHTIVHARDSVAAARFVAEILGLPAPTVFGPFQVVETSNDVSLDFIDADGPFESQHYAFLISEPEFDEIFGRIQERGLEYWADPARSRPGQINTHDGGRGVYFCNPDGHFLEIITRTYGSG
ncbi:MAG TPA: VOC family protein [Acidimicrobiales bacterium]|nr:VOC family protein [Acidimicrobiales bacterium]